MKIIISEAHAKSCGFPVSEQRRTCEVLRAPEHNLIGCRGYDVFYTVTRPVFPHTAWVVAGAHVDRILEG